MAKKKDEKMVGRVMRQVIGPGNITISNAALTGGTMDGYEVNAGPAKSVLVYQLNQYFDLSAYSLQDLTTYIQGVLFQRIGTYQFSEMQVDTYLREYIIVHKTPLDLNTDLEDGSALLIPGSVPGGPNSDQGLDNIIQGWCGVYAQDAGAGFGRLIESQTWGAGNSTAASRLYFTRFLVFPKLQSDDSNATYKFAWPALGIVVPIIVDKEPDLEYIMRLARSVDTL